MKWLLKRIAAGLAAVLVVAVGAAVLLGAQFSGEQAPWAASTGHDGVWLSGSWVNGEHAPEEIETVLGRLREGGFTDVYVHVGEIAPDGSLDPAGYAAAEPFLSRLRAELPDARVLGWMSHTAESSSLVEDQFNEEQRATIAAAAAAVVDAGFDGIHYAIAPITTNDPTLPDVLERTRAAIGPERTLSVRAHPLELLTGMRMPVLLFAGKEVFWSTGYLTRVAERADTVVIQGHGTGMPVKQLYGGFMVRQTELALESVPEDVTVRIAAPAFDDESLGPTSRAETVATATSAVRIGLTKSGQRRERMGMGLYVLDGTDDQEWAAFRDNWLVPKR
ncbi:hypothetical protein [Salinactinospora qingdaonensis]|uniref:hypothetical protein n=1 Tax=Salinactinospora qingdaonensis TaxID=702744 RepID=UPI0031E9A958